MTTDMRAEVVSVQGMTFLGRADSNHWLALGADPSVGGDGGSPKPLELILIGLAGCTALDVISILRKKRAPFTTVRVSAEAKRTEDHPRVFTAIHLTYTVHGAGVGEADVAEAIRLSQEKYCPAAAMLSRACPITSEFHIEP